MESLPSQVGIMVLPGAVLFPHNLLPLRIFEPRYRAMLAEALDSHRMFAIGTPDPALRGKKVRPLPVAGLGLIRACVENEDGTSNLILQGVARVRFSEFSRDRPFFAGCPESLACRDKLSAGGEATMRRIVGDILALAQASTDLPDGLGEYLGEVRDPDILADVIAGTFLKDPERRQDLLETPEIELRVEKLAGALRAEYPNLKSL